MTHSQEKENHPYSEEKAQKKLFISYVNSYVGNSLLEKFQDYKVYGTIKKCHHTITNVTIIDSKNYDFTNLIAQCNVIICDISQDKNQLEEAKIIVKFLEDYLEDAKNVTITIILISTIMTWAKTVKNNEEPLTDKHYRKRRPHPCFNQHILVERQFLNLQKKFKQSLKCFVICPGIIYGREQDIFHYIYKSAYINRLDVEIFLPASNFLPIVHINDFTRIVMEILNKPMTSNYFLAVQQVSLTSKNIAKIFAESMGGDEMRIKICRKEDIFLMNEDVMNQRIYDHLTLDLILVSEMLDDFQYEFTGSNLEEKSHILVKEFFSSRKLRPIKILIDGSPFSYQKELSKMLSDYYHLHHVKNKCFLKNCSIRLKKKVEGAEDYLAKMDEISSELNEEIDFSAMLLKVQNDINNLNEKIEVLERLIATPENLTFNEKKEFINDRLLSIACSRNQGYVMSEFELNSEKASSIFLDNSNDEELSDLKKPDFVIILNRVMDINPDCLEVHKKLYGDDINDEEKRKQWKLKEYYETQYEDTSLSNFFIDRDLIPIEVTIDHDLNESEIKEIFERLKGKIGEPCCFELSQEEKEEIGKLKCQIAEMEENQKIEEENRKVEMEREKQIDEWTNEKLEAKRKEIEEFEQKTLPIREYLHKFILPNIEISLKELARVRPSNPIQFLAHHLMHQEPKIDDDFELDEDIIREFKRLVSESKCE